MREVLSSLSRGQSEYIQPKTIPYFMDLHDHNLRLLELIDAAREKASTAMDAHLSVSSNSLNEIMKVLTIFAAIVVIPTLIASIYGMNFNSEKSPWNMPELHWYWGYPACLAVMAALTIALVIFFRRKGWLGGESTKGKQNDRTGTS